MNFFVTYNYLSELSGIEHAQKKRYLALQKFGEKAKFVSLAYNRFLSRDATISGINYKNIINMYDYFQRTNSIFTNQSLIVHVSDVINEDEYIVNANNGILEINKNRKHIKTIYLMQNAESDDQIDKIEYFDKYSNVSRIDYFDIRGFLSMSDIMGQQGGVAREINYDIKGNSVLESFYHFDSNRNVETSWMLRINDNLYWFSDKKNLEAKFLDLLNIDFKEKNTFISDRAYLTDPGLLNMKSSRKLYIFWHSVFVPENEHANKFKPFDTLINEIKYKDKIDGLLAGTIKEVNDLKKAVSGELKVYQLNSFVKFSKSKYQNTLLPNNKKKYDIVTVSRISSEKRILLGIEIFYKLHKKLPDVHWDIFGYGNSEYMDIVKTAIINKNLSGFVTLHNYISNINNIYKNSKIFWMLSKFEGFNMAEAEAQTYGVPTIAFDIDYGPSELIKNGQNGFLIPNNETYNFYEKTVHLLNSPSELLQMSSCARRETDRYLPDALFTQWNQIIAE
ncbi:glycosyltransferase [Fructobacillus cardui]|uniref:Glycosyltransferase involved in cell wall bisynthesis (RfaB) n=1 Tax=Fructobacillus cardui TaxID=2893170 RepID=A0ABN9YZX8_9LACO|nr:Glycosyltransferase involved in cell wall bisynthesis (RfaB) [Fructobacillus cardui]